MAADLQGMSKLWIESLAFNCSLDVAELIPGVWAQVLAQSCANSFNNL